jgi:hypothetical protein
MGLLAPCGLKRDRCFLWQPIPCRQNHRGTEARDRGVKFKAYQGCPTMHEIVLMSQFAQYVEIWQRDDQDIAAWHYRHYGPGEMIEINSIGLQIDIADGIKDWISRKLNQGKSSCAYNDVPVTLSQYTVF